jgi:hypothetical protein
MIQLASTHLLVSDDQGRKQSFDAELLRRDLSQAFASVGVTEDWLTEHIALIIEERIRSAHDEEERPMSIGEADKLVATVLGAAGYNDVGSEFSRQRGVDPLSHYREAMQPYSLERVSALLRRDLPLGEAQLQLIARQCMELLEQQAFGLVSDKLICELAIHLVHRAPRPADTPRASDDSDQWQQGVSAATRAFMDSAALRALPLSSIFPRARIALDLAALCAAHESAWISELSLFSAVLPLCQGALELLTVMRDELHERLPNCADAPSHAIFPAYKSFLDSAFADYKRRERLLLSQRLQEFLQAALVSKAPFPLLLSMR